MPTNANKFKGGGGKASKTPSSQTKAYYMVRINYREDIENMTKKIEEFLNAICSDWNGNLEQGGKNGMKHYQLALKCNPKKTQGAMINAWVEEFNHLKDHLNVVMNEKHMTWYSDDKEWYCKPSTSAAANSYCAKDETCIEKLCGKGKMAKPEPLRELKFPDSIGCKWWQREAMQILNKEPDDRTVMWFWSQMGSIGKTTFCKWLCAEHGAIVLEGKGADCKNAVLDYIQSKKRSPRIVVYDIPRSTDEKYISYSTLEKVKNMFFYSGKYEGGQVNCPPCHLIVFANYAPLEREMSLDRWMIRNLDVVPSEIPDLVCFYKWATNNCRRYKWETEHKAQGDCVPKRQCSKEKHSAFNKLFNKQQ